VFVLTMAGAAVAGLFGAAATAPLARLVIDARDIIREHRAGAPEADTDAGPPDIPAAERPPAAPAAEGPTPG
jgi:hypothetical protein